MALQVDSAVGTCAIATIATYGNLAKVFQFYVRLLVHVGVRFHVCFRVRFRIRFHVRFRIHVPFHARVNTALRIFLSDMANIQLISKARTRWRGNLKDLSLERGWTKSAENIGASPLKRDLSVDTTFSQINLAGQSF